MTGDLYLYADETLDYLRSAVQKAERIHELALEKRGPMAKGEEAEVRRLARDLCSVIDDAGTAAQAVRDQTD